MFKAEMASNEKMHPPRDCLLRKSSFLKTFLRITKLRRLSGISSFCHLLEDRQDLLPFS
jgi:hypothetical protein